MAVSVMHRLTGEYVYAVTPERRGKATETYDERTIAVRL